MEKRRYDRLVEDIAGLMDGERLGEALSVERKDRRTDMVVMVLRDALYRSDIGMYNGVMYHFSGRIYEPIDSDDFGNLVYDVLMRVGLPFGDFSKIEGILRVCRRRVSTKPLSVSNDIMVFRNCVYDIGRGEVHGFSPDYVQFSAAGYDYDPAARGYKWQDFLNQVLPNRVYQLVLQEFIGSLFIDRKKAKMEMMLVLLGGGANGKSVVFEAVQGIIGEKNVSHFGISDLIGEGNEKKRNLATMNGKRLNYASETGSFTIDGGSGMLKAVISGEPVEARPMYGDNFTASDLPLIIINANKMPVLKDFSNGMRRRLMIIPFEQTIPPGLQNKELGNELRDEYPAIFNWALVGRERFISNGYRLTECSILEDLIDDYQILESGALRFVKGEGLKRANEMVTDSEPVWIMLKALYDRYRDWCVRNDEAADSKTMFSKALRDYGFRCHRTGGGIEFAVYGEAAYIREIRRLRKERYEAEAERSELTRRQLTEKKREDVRAYCRRALQWDNVALGFRELKEHTKRYTCDFSAELRNGNLEGTYKVIHDLYVFNLELIDAMWLPAYDDRVNRRYEKLAERRKQKDLMRAYSELEIEQYFEDLKDEENGEIEVGQLHCCPEDGR